MARRGRKASFSFRYSNRDLQYANLSKGSLTMAEMKSEYSRARAAANKRLQRLSGTEFSDSDLLKSHEGGFPKLSDIKGKTDLAHELASIHTFLTQKYSTISGQADIMDENIQTFRSHGYDFVDKSNYRALINFLEDAKTRVDASAYGSEFIMELFHQSERLKISRQGLLDDMEYWSEHMADLASWDKSFVDQKMGRKGNRRVSSNRLKDLLGGL